MQLRESETLRTFYHHHRGVGHVHADFNHGSSDEYLCFLLNEILHFIIARFTFHLTVHDAHVILWHRKAAHDGFVAVLQVFVIHHFTFCDERIHDVDLTPFANFIFHESKNFQSLSVGFPIGLDGLSSRR